METVDWLKAHRVEIVEHWNHRVRPLVREAGSDAPWEKRIEAAFDQVCVLMAEDGIEAAEAEVEEKLFRCSRIKEHDGHRFSAELLANGRMAIGEVSRKFSGDSDAQRCAEECGNVIGYLQHVLRMNICRDCKEINCCMRVESFEPLSGESNE